MNDLKKSVAEIIPMSVSDEQVKDCSWVWIESLISRFRFQIGNFAGKMFRLHLDGWQITKLDC